MSAPIDGAMNAVAVGIDLAWSGRNPTGVSLLRWGGKRATLIAAPTTVRSDDQIIDAIRPYAAESTLIVAIDAPTLVPNLTGQRRAESLLNTRFRRYDAGAHPSNRTRLGGYNNGMVRGEQIVTRLAELDIAHTPYIEPRISVRACFEVYPHPAMIALFSLTKTLKYKQKPTSTAQSRQAAFQEYQRHLKGLQNATPACSLPADLLEQSLISLNQRQIKDYEDRLDSVLCAYIALYYWYWGLEKCHIFGDDTAGYIVTPIDDRTRPYV